MADWAASLPAHCAVFGVNGPTAGEAAAAFAAAHRPMPRSLTLVGVDGFTPVEPGKPHPVTSSVMVDFELAGFLAAKMVAGRVRGSRDVPAAATFGPLLCIRRDSTRGFGRREPFVMAAAEMIRRKACDGLTASALAAHFDCSRNLFERRFREAMGRSVLDEIIHVRLEQVLLLLERPEVPIGAIASFCGFGSDIALIKLFKKRFGVSMRDWRKKHGH
jgi:AraC-like DNA-binding protein